VRRGADVRCTTRQSNTHGSELRKLVYPWHPWAGREIWIGETLSRNGGTILRCVVDHSSNAPAIEIPQWMFETAVCWQMRLEASPWVNVEALRELKGSLAFRLRGLGEAVIEAQHCPLSLEGGADESRGEVATGDATQTVSAGDSNSELAAVAARNPAIDGTFTGATPMPARRQRLKADGGSRR
jgi:hypothetical protein